MDRNDVIIKIIVINKTRENSYKNNSEYVHWTKEEEAQIKYYKYNSPTKKRMTWKNIGIKLNKSPSLVKKIWHRIIEKKQHILPVDYVSPCPLCCQFHF
jgi:hypothetical protein